MIFQKKKKKKTSAAFFPTVPLVFQISIELGGALKMNSSNTKFLMWDSKKVKKKM